MNWRKLFLQWLPWAFVITIIFGTMFACTQYILRSGANDPQIELAENTVQKLINNTQPDGALPSGDTVDIRTSLSPYVLIFDDSGKLLTANARLNNQLPVIPKGVLDHARNKENRVTWQPAGGVRSAIVAKHYSGTNSGFVVAGRSLREIEKRENNLLFIIGTTWIITLVLLVSIYWLSSKNE